MNKIDNQLATCLGRLEEAVNNLRETNEIIRESIARLQDQFLELQQNYNQLKGALRTWKFMVVSILIPLSGTVIGILMWLVGK